MDLGFHRTAEIPPLLFYEPFSSPAITLRHISFFLYLSPSSNNGLFIFLLPPLQTASPSWLHLVLAFHPSSLSTATTQPPPPPPPQRKGIKEETIWQHLQTEGEREREMMLGKRQRPPMRRTTSTTEFSLDEVFADVEESNNLSETQNHYVAAAMHPSWMRNMGPAGSMLSPRGTPRRNSADYTAMETASFLKACGLCNRRLAPGRDIFMYRYILSKYLVFSSFVVCKV